MKVTVVGTGYVGLVTGVALAEVGHQITCFDINERKIETLNKGESPIYEPGLEDLLNKNLKNGNLRFTTEKDKAYTEVEIIFIAVGTPQNLDGTADLTFVKSAAEDIARYLKNDALIVIKSTVPVGTNEIVQKIISEYIDDNIHFEMASNPEFLREGAALHDTFNGDRIVVGTNNSSAAQKLEKLFAPFQIPFYHADIASAEMIKYASNAFLATKISFINEIANICERIGANVEDVAAGMGMDQRIGRHFLNAGIGYGGSCFPKDTHALVQIAGNVNHEFDLLKSVIVVNNKQQMMLMNKMRDVLGTLVGKKIAMLGLAFKPNTDDMREAASIVLAGELIESGAKVFAYDPIAKENAIAFLPAEVIITETKEEALASADAALIVTEWEEFKNMDLDLYNNLMKKPVVFDGRNCYKLSAAQQYGLSYYSIGRPPVISNIKTEKAEI